MDLGQSRRGLFESFQTFRHRQANLRPQAAWGETASAAEHLEAFLATPPASGETERWVRHARETLAQLREGGGPGAGSAATDPATGDERTDVPPPDYAR